VKELEDLKHDIERHLTKVAALEQELEDQNATMEKDVADANERLKHDLKVCADSWAKGGLAAGKLFKEHERYKKALEFYADEQL